MLTSTSSDARPRLFLNGSVAPRGGYAGLLDARPAPEGLCSAGGPARRPRLGRLRRALSEDLFVQHFQPIFSVADRGVRCYEALLRLADEPGGRVLAPGHFLPAAERYGLIREIDRMVLEKVAVLLAQRRSGRRAGARELRIAMNLSAISVSDGAMLAHLERRLALLGVDPAQLMIEVTETAAISDMTRARAFCAGVQALGCAVALDDFGAGFGSFRYLKHLPFDYLKIDGDFIHGLPRSRTDQLVVKALVGLVQGLGRQTIAEFVGDEATMRLLRAYGVDCAQGFHLGRPQPTLAPAF